jgi:nitroreductase
MGDKSMDLFEAIRTTRAMRRLDPDRPVSEADLRTLVEAATKAATGGNSTLGGWSSRTLSSNAGWVWFIGAARPSFSRTAKVKTSL